MIIQFRDAEDKEVGFQVSVDALTTSKADLNKLLDDMKEEDDEVQRY